MEIKYIKLGRSLASLLRSYIASQVNYERVEGGMGVTFVIL